MAVLRFFLHLFTFICMLAGSILLVMAACLMVRFPPLVVAVVVGCALFAIVLTKTTPRT
jgi:hypothetical protein